MATIVVFAAPELFKTKNIFVKPLLVLFAISTINFIRLALSTLHARSKSSEEHIPFNKEMKDLIFNLLLSLNIKMKKTASFNTASNSLISFLDISSQKSSDYVQSFLNTNSKESLKDLFSQIHEISGIAKEKCYYYNISSYALRIQLFFFLLIIFWSCIGS